MLTELADGLGLRDTLLFRLSVDLSRFSSTDISEIRPKNWFLRFSNTSIASSMN
jgi:hypothetical protein